MTRAAHGTLLVAVLGAALSVLRTAAGGQDLNYDFTTYHFYLGFSAFNARLGADFLPASFQGYQSPLPYALPYLLDSAGVPSLANASLAACLHSLNLVVLFLLTRVLVAGTRLEGDRVAIVALWLLGAVAPLYWQLVGTSFADLQASVLVLASLWLAATRRFALAGVLAGVAVAMRVHTAIFALALAAALLLMPFPSRREKARGLGSFGAAAAAAWLICFAPWGIALYREFGNPLFPFYNALFRSPDFPLANLPLTSFVPSGVAELVALPFRMATHREWLYAEKPLPDVRPALLFLAALGLAAAWAYRRFVRRAPAQALADPGRRFAMHFFLIAVVLWLATSANGRYGVALFLLAGPVCGVLLAAVLPARRHVLLAVGVALAWQLALQEVFFRQQRWASGPWAERYFDWDVPPRLAREPALYLSFGYMTASTLAPRVHARSRHANLVGQYTTDLEHPGAQRFRALIESPPGRIYGVFDFAYTQQPDPAARSIKRYFGDHLRRWGLDFGAELCTLVALRAPAAAWRRVNDFFDTGYRGTPPELIVCELRRASPDENARALREYRDFQRKLARFAAGCPRLLDGAISIVRVPGQWWVSTLASFEYRLEFPDSGPFYLQLQRPPYTAAKLGAITPDGIVVSEPDCNGWFARFPR